MIRVNDLRLKRLDTFRRVAWSHRLRHVHRHERHVDILHGLRLGRALGVAHKVKALASQRNDVAIPTALGMVEFAGLGPCCRLYIGTASMPISVTVLLSPFARTIVGAVIFAPASLATAIGMTTGAP